MINKTELKGHFIILLHSTRHLTNRQRDLGWGVQCPNLKFFIVSPIEQVPQTTTFSTTISAYSFLMQHLGQWSRGMHESFQTLMSAQITLGSCANAVSDSEVRDEIGISISYKLPSHQDDPGPRVWDSSKSHTNPCHSQMHTVFN